MTRHDARNVPFHLVYRDYQRQFARPFIELDRPEPTRPIDYIANESVILLREQPFFTFIRGISIIRSIRVCVFAVECIVSIVFSRRRLVTFVKGRRRRSIRGKIQKEESVRDEDLTRGCTA